MKPDGSIIELCHVTRDLDAALLHWTHDLGAGPFFVFDVPVLPGQLYYGEPTEVSMRVGCRQRAMRWLIQERCSAASAFVCSIQKRRMAATSNSWSFQTQCRARLR